MQDYMNNFVPTGCQYVNNASSDDFILSPQRGETCLKNASCRLYMNNQTIICNFWSLDQKRKIRFQFFFYNQDNTCLIWSRVMWDESELFYNM